MPYILWCMLLLKFEDPIAHYLEMHHFLWDSTHVLCIVRQSFVVLVFSQSANRQSQN